jgi:hypothetical protein
MSTKANPGPNSCYDRALLDEPIFTLLGRDPTAPFVVLFWAKMRNVMFGDAEIAQCTEAQACAEQMRDWAMKLGKRDKLAIAFEAFKKACFEVAKAELEASQAEPSPENPE